MGPGLKVHSLYPDGEVMHRILHVIDTLNHGGAAHQLLLNLTHLDSKVFQSYVCCIGQIGALAADVMALGVPVYSLETKGKPGWIKAAFQVQRLVKSLNIDLIH